MWSRSAPAEEGVDPRVRVQALARRAGRTVAGDGAARDEPTEPDETAESPPSAVREASRHRASSDVERPGVLALVRGALADRVPPALVGARTAMSRRAAVGLVLVAVLAVSATWWLGRGRALEVPSAPSASAAVSFAPDGPSVFEPTTAQTLDVVVVHVSGLVAVPGVYELPAGSRVVDAIARAGGVEPGTDTSTLNLARVLTDGEQVAVGVPPAPDAAIGGGSLGSSGAGQVDLNRATAAELDALPGVGPVLAGRIVEWREAHGAFTAVEELLEVSGIGEATLADIAPLVRL